MCPDECPGLCDAYGDEFEKLYESYEQKKMYRKQVKAREVWRLIMESQIETGVPYIAFKDAVNNKSNQKHYGTIKGLNLCCEICEYSDDKEVAVCNLASISLPKFIKTVNGKKVYDFQKLHDVMEAMLSDNKKSRKAPVISMAVSLAVILMLTFILSPKPECPT